MNDLDLVECEICGETDYRYKMWDYSYGRRTLWLCNKCHQSAHREVNMSEAMKKRRRKVQNDK